MNSRAHLTSLTYILRPICPLTRYYFPHTINAFSPWTNPAPPKSGNSTWPFTYCIAPTPLVCACYWYRTIDPYTRIPPNQRYLRDYTSISVGIPLQSDNGGRGPERLLATKNGIEIERHKGKGGWSWKTGAWGRGYMVIS